MLALPPFALKVAVTVTVFRHMAIKFVFLSKAKVTLFPASPAVAVDLVVVVSPVFFHPIIDHGDEEYAVATGVVILHVVGLVALLYTVAIVQLLFATLPVGAKFVVALFFGYAVNTVPALLFRHI